MKAARSYAFDADVLIYAVHPGEPLGAPVRRLLDTMEPSDLWGSALLLPELLSKPLREGRGSEVELLQDVLAHLQLVAVSEVLGLQAAQLAATYHLKAADAVHLASAVWCGSDAFLTNNRKDFRASDVQEIQVLYPDQL